MKNFQSLSHQLQAIAREAADYWDERPIREAGLISKWIFVHHAVIVDSNWIEAYVRPLRASQYR